MKLISLNIEGYKHFTTVLPFLKSEQADCICLQEVFKQDFDYLQKELGMQGVFAVMSNMKYATNTERDREPLPWGVAIFTKHTFQNINMVLYYGDQAVIPVYELYNTLTINKVLLTATISCDGESFNVGTTHFTWTHDGSVNEQQRTDLKSLLRALDTTPELILCGDFNAPRASSAVFTTLAQRFKDNIPARYTTSIDGNLHRAGQLPHMVDGLFTTPSYQAYDVVLQCGVSDHCAVVAHIKRCSP